MAKLSIFSGTKKNEISGLDMNESASRMNGASSVHSTAVSDNAAGLLSEAQFRRMLCRERKRSERSRKHLLLMLIDGKATDNLKDEVAFLHQVAECLNETMRETDLAGWFEANSVFGVIFTELGQTDIKLAMNVIQTKVTAALQRSFSAGQLNSILVSFYAFPDGWEGNGNGQGHTVNPALYPDLFETEKKKKVSLGIKRAMDIVGGSMALVAASPLFLGLAVAVKFSSRGPVFFRQERVGQYGVRFKFLKFRSMKVSNNAEIHKEYVKKFIAGKAGSSSATGNGEANNVFKITNDPRITWLGRIMRRASLDELPQFWNVLCGEMSLVGPRPPIPYEIESYDVWHRRRLLEVKPGITGLWQVHGRSKTTFDEMVRLDIQYSQTWTPLLDAKILLKTPRAVISGDGAY
jgi:lipopolysaccharide/colanic/teichoic acid biosynthesis glycosyltransferase/GGDEF domain-containing protein